jgi:hypothetical protein
MKGDWQERSLAQLSRTRRARLPGGAGLVALSLYLVASWRWLYVRFGAHNGLKSGFALCPLCATSGLTRRSKLVVLFDDFVGLRKQRRRHREVAALRRDVRFTPGQDLI